MSKSRRTERERRRDEQSHLPYAPAPTDASWGAPRDAPPAVTSLPYDIFLVERQRFIDGRQRVQQRVDQLVTGGAAGALALSITFVEKLAPSVLAWTRLLLLGAWGTLALSLCLSLISHYVSVRAFDATIVEFDRCYQHAAEFHSPASTRYAQVISYGAAATLIGGVLLLAAFAFLNMQLVFR
jgi:hypothetical protein